MVETKESNLSLSDLEFFWDTGFPSAFKPQNNYIIGIQIELWFNLSKQSHQFCLIDFFNLRFVFADRLYRNQIGYRFG